MSIAALKRVSLCGMVVEKDPVLDQLQSLGCLHLISLREESGEAVDFSAQPPKEACRVLKFLRDCPQKRHQISRDDKFSIDDCVREVMRIQQDLRTVSDRRDFLAARIKAMEPWGDFSFPPDDYLSEYRLWFYIVPVGQIRDLSPDQSAWQLVHKDTRFAYVVVIAKEEPPPDSMPVARTHTGSHSLSELRMDLNQVELQLEDLQAERESMTRWIFMISRNLAQTEDKAGLRSACAQTLDIETLFAVQGWVAEMRLPNLLEFADAKGLALLLEEPAETDTPPTLLENPQSLRAGEGLVNFYQTPGYWDWDPAIPVFFSFTLFFAMILSDAGYAALLGLILMVYWRRIGDSAVGPSGRMLVTVLVGSSILWGVLVGSYFGLSPPVDSVPGMAKVLDLNNFDEMMRLSVCIGVLHLSFANLHRAWRLRGQGLSGLIPLGWILVMFGALFLRLDQSLDTAPNWVAPAGKFKLLLGIAVVFVFSGQRKISGPVDLLLALLDGLKGLTGIIRIFGDVLSYLRLFALGLASASLALTFNNLAVDVREGVQGPGLLFSLLILVVGHGLNILLSLMSAVVHGMRLNCIEFFNWGLSDEGYLFKAFSKKEVGE